MKAVVIAGLLLLPMVGFAVETPPTDNTKPSAAAASTTPAAPDAQSLQDAVASVVVVALTEQFDGRSVAVNIDDYAVQVLGARQRTVTGRGTVQVGGKSNEDAVSFTYRTLFDVVTGQAAYPTIMIDGVGEGSERVVPNDAELVDQLDERVAKALSNELGGKQVWLQLDQIESYESGERYVRINAAGVADLGSDGPTPARIEALYDRKKDSWLRVNYTLGSNASTGGQLLGGG